MTEIQFDLPETVEAWSRSGGTRIVDSNTIFKYMNGGGELYLAYDFDHMEITEYKAPQKEDILVEIYVMQNADDAFGLLSLDWDGEPISLGASLENLPRFENASPDRALYGMGLLRLCAGRLYARILAFRETPEARKAILSLGRAIASGLKLPDEPNLLRILPQSTSTQKLRKDRIGYFHTHLVLNSLYYISHRNILNLDHDTAAVTATYEIDPKSKSNRKSQLLFIEYPDPASAVLALGSFHDAYLSEFEKISHSGFFKVEDGWMGYLIDRQHLAIVFECPDKASAEKLLGNILPKS